MTPVDDCESAAGAFRRARSASSNKGDASFFSVAAARGLAVALRRRRLSVRQQTIDSSSTDENDDQNVGVLLPTGSVSYMLSAVFL